VEESAPEARISVDLWSGALHGSGFLALLRSVPQVSHEEMTYARCFGAAMKSIHCFVDPLVVHRRALVLAQVFRPRTDEERLPEMARVIEIVKK